MIDGKTVLCGLIGDPVAHSLSPAIHNAAFEALDLNYTYLAFRVDNRNVDLALAGMKVLGARGLNVTVPHKISVITFLDEIDDEAREIGAVNTIVNNGGLLKGYNTDAAGFMLALEAAGFDPRGKKAVILGTGGAARAVASALTRKGMQLVILSRQASLEKGQKLAGSVSKDALAQEITALKEVLPEAALLVNATSAGMYPRVDETLVPAQLLRPDLTVFDIVYSPRDTRLLKDARAAGCRTIEGLDMLLYQAAASFRLWTGKMPPIDLMRQAALSELGSSPAARTSLSLIGFMGCGKSSIGKLLSRKLGYKLIDTDKIIEKTSGKSISKIFSEEGQQAFRAYEMGAVKDLADSSPSVIACGGGVILNPENVSRLKELSVVIYLKASAPILAARLSHARGRPLLKTGNRQAAINALLGDRAVLYEQAADIIVDTSNLNEEAVTDVIITELRRRNFPGIAPSGDLK